MRRSGPGQRLPTRGVRPADLVHAIEIIAAGDALLAPSMLAACLPG